MLSWNGEMQHTTAMFVDCMFSMLPVPAIVYSRSSCFTCQMDASAIKLSCCAYTRILAVTVHEHLLRACTDLQVLRVSHVLLDLQSMHC